MLRNILFALAGIALLSAGIGIAYFARNLDTAATAQPPAAPLVDVAQPRPVSTQPAIRETGFVRAYDRVEIAPEVAGRIVRIGAGFSLGAQVAKGDLLVELEARPIRTDLARAKADLASARAARDQASARLERQQELAGDDFAAEAEVERARADAAAARARVTQAKAAIEAAELRLEDTRLTAPFDALVVAENVSPGQLLQVGAPIGTLVASNIAEVRVGLSEPDFRRLRRAGALPGRDVTVTSAEGDNVAGRIARTAPVLEGRARTVEIVIEVDDPFAPEQDLVLNGLVTVKIPLPDSDRRLFRLPAAALHTGAQLWRVTDDQTLERVAADVADRGDDTVFVTSDDLDPEDRLLLTEVQTPLPGLQVRLRDQEQGQGQGTGGTQENGPAE